MSTTEDRVRALGALHGAPTFDAGDIEAAVGRRRGRRRAGIAMVSVASVVAIVLGVTQVGGDQGSQSVRTGPAAEVTTTTQPGQRYETTALVLETEDHGPVLCLGGVEDSLPPQCGGVPVIGWDWAQVADVEQSRNARWADVHVVGTFDGETFTLTEPPSAPEDIETELPDSYFAPACEQPTGDLTLTQGDTYSINLPGGVPPTFPGQVAFYLSQGPPFVVNVVVTPGNGAAATAQAQALWSGGLCVVERDAPTEAELGVIQNEVSALMGDDDTPLGQIHSVGADNKRGVVSVGLIVVTDEALAYVQERWGALVELFGQLTPVDPER